MRALLLFILCVGCSSPAPPDNPGGPAVCEGGPNEPAVQVEQRVAATGRTVSSLREADGVLYIVESGDNTVSRFIPATGVYEQWVDVGNERGPYDVAITSAHLWITNYVADTVTVADRSTGEVLAELRHPSFDGPSGVAVLDGRAYVSSVQFRGEGAFGVGAVTVIDAENFEVLGALPTAYKNPQALDVAAGELLITSTGEFDYDGAYRAKTPSAVEVWTPTQDPLRPEVRVAELPLVQDRRIGGLGRPAVRDGAAVVYFPSAVGPFVFSLDVNTMTWLRGSDDPIQLYDTAHDALHHAAHAGDVLYVTAFNEDKLYLVDTTCDAVLDEVLLEPTSALAGPHGVVVIGDAAYFVLEFSMELGRAMFDFQSRSR